MKNILEVKDMNLWYSNFQALKNINMEIPENQITAFIGPSGCGKSTFLKSLNRMNDLISELKIKLTIVIVTHNMQQAVRVSDKTAFFLLGELIEYADTEKMFSFPEDKRTEDYITGRFG